jgi:hypothetical protein
MSLNYDLTKITDYKSLCWREAKDEKGQTVIGADGQPVLNMDAITYTLVFGTIMVGFREITEANAEEFTTRLRDWWSVDSEGPIREWIDGADLPVERHVTIEEVRAHIGLKTNAINYSARKFASLLKKRIASHKADEARRQARQQQASA